MTPRWIYNLTDRLWELYISGRRQPIYSVASRREPDDDETTAILVRLTRFYPWLAAAGREAAA